MINIFIFMLLLPFSTATCPQSIDQPKVEPVKSPVKFDQYFRPITREKYGRKYYNLILIEKITKKNQKPVIIR